MLTEASILRLGSKGRYGSLLMAGKTVIKQSTCMVHGIQTTSKRSGMDHTVPVRTPWLPIPRKRSPDGASTDWGGEHLIAANYSFIDLRRWKAELTWLAELQRTVYPHKWSPISWRSSVWQGKFASQDWRSCHCATPSTIVPLYNMCHTWAL